jgi:hypothetical protein
LAGGVNLYSYAGSNPVAYTDPFGLCKYLNNTTAPCELFLAAFSEVSPRHAEVEAGAVAGAIINRAEDNSHNYGYTNTGNLDADIKGQVLAPNQVQGVGNGEWNKLQGLFDGRPTVFNPGDAAKLAGVVRGVESAYVNRASDTKGSTYWDHPPSRAGQGASQKYCAPTITDTAGTAELAKCSK